MGKIKRPRNRYNNLLSKERIEKEKSANLDGDNTRLDIESMRQLNLVKGMKKQNLEDKNFDLRSVISGVSSVSNSRQGTKKGRRNQRHVDLLRRVDTIKLMKQKDKDRKRREKAKITGDLHPMIEALPGLADLQLLANKKEKQRQTKKNIEAKKKSSLEKEVLSDMQLMIAVNQDKTFRDDPFGCVEEAIRNRLLQENE